ncbi:MAG: hypothetical protein LBV69_05685 [Bacteroidales bacterium]|jgi:hypothetical protein|nr:hypothetical protein [Bacteroidales bacterium]
MIKKAIILIVIVVSLVGCKKTDQDIEWEQKLIGFQWEPIDNIGNRIWYVPILEFNEESRGKSYIRLSSENKDEFGWEIRNKELRLFYDKAPSDYSIGQDQYNSKALFQIKTVSENIVEVAQLTSGGYELSYSFRKITNEENSEQ